MSVNKAMCAGAVFALTLVFTVIVLRSREKRSVDLFMPLTPGLQCTEPLKDLGKVWRTDELSVPFELVNRHPQST